MEGRAHVVAGMGDVGGPSVHQTEVTRSHQSAHPERVRIRLSMECIVLITHTQGARACTVATTHEWRLATRLADTQMHTCPHPSLSSPQATPCSESACTHAGTHHVCSGAREWTKVLGKSLPQGAACAPGQRRTKAKTQHRGHMRSAAKKRDVAHSTAQHCQGSGREGAFCRALSSQD